MGSLLLIPGLSWGAWAQPQSKEAQERAEQALRAGRYQAASEEYAKLVARWPRSAELWSNLGTARALSGNCGQALPALERARALNPRLYTPWYLSGFCHLNAHRNEEAEGELTRAVKLNPLDANAWFLKAEAESNLDRLGDSFRAVVESLSLDPNRPEAYYLAGKDALELAVRCYSRTLAAPASVYGLILDGERNASQRVFDLATEEYQKAQGQDPENPAIVFALGTAHLQNGRYPDAEQAFQRAMALAPGSNWVRLRLALVFAEEGKSDKASQVLRSVPFDGVYFPEEFNDFLACAYLTRQPELGLKVLAEAEKRFPDRPELRESWDGRFRSLTAEAKGDPPALDLPDLTGVGLSVRFLAAAGSDDDLMAGIFPGGGAYADFHQAFLGQQMVRAAKALTETVSPLPEDAGRSFILGELLHEFSYRFYDELGRKFPESAAAMTLAAENYAALGEQGKAREILQALLQKDGPSPDLLRHLAESYWTEHKWDDALGVLAQLAQIDPSDPTIFVNVGRIFAYETSWGSAENNFRHALSIDPKMFEAHFGLAQALERQGKTENALREFQMSSEIDPSNPRPHYALAQLYRKLGQARLAEQQMAQFQRIQAEARPESMRKARGLVPID